MSNPCEYVNAYHLNLYVDVCEHHTHLILLMHDGRAWVYKLEKPLKPVLTESFKYSAFKINNSNDKIIIFDNIGVRHTFFNPKVVYVYRPGTQELMWDYTVIMS